MSKRVLDLFLVIPAIILLSPLMAVVALWVKCGSAGPVLFRQQRVGQYGKPFKIFKFRTMVDGSENKGNSITVDGDLRITRNGKILRKCKLDELPQLFNVLMGEMSLVGPRPELAEYVALYPEGVRKKVLSVPPGLAPPDPQIFRNESQLLAEVDDPMKSYVEEVLPRKLDDYVAYVDHWSLAKDIGIMWKTFLAVVRG